LAEEFRRRGHQTRFLCNGRAVEQAFFAAADDAISLGIDESRLPRAAALMRAMLRARRAAREFVPDLVVALGGAGSTASLAVGGKVPLVALEGNAVVGKSVRLLDRFARTTFTLFPGPAAALRRGQCVGPIARDCLFASRPENARASFGLAPDGPTLLVLGGSQGARDLNVATVRMAPALAAQKAQALVIAGPAKAEQLRAEFASAGLSAQVLEHCSEMGAAYAAADLVLCRGGAATMAELWLLGKPGVVAPYPYHKDRQQEHNARALEPGVRQIDARRAEHDHVVLELLSDPRELGRMSQFLAQLGPGDGRGMTADLMEEIALARA